MRQHEVPFAPLRVHALTSSAVWPAVHEQDLGNHIRAREALRQLMEESAIGPVAVLKPVRQMHVLDRDNTAPCSTSELSVRVHRVLQGGALTTDAPHAFLSLKQSIAATLRRHACKRSSMMLNCLVDTATVASMSCCQGVCSPSATLLIFAAVLWCHSVSSQAGTEY